MDAITSSGNYLGTERVKRPLTDAESRQLAKLLRDHDFPGASLVALRFAYKLTRSREAARDLVGRMNLRLVRWGWDPNAVSLVRRLCRLVWSEHTHQERETDVAVRAEQAFLHEQAVEAERALQAAAVRGDRLPLAPPLPAQPVAASTEQHAIRLEEEREQDARRARELEKLHGGVPALEALFRERKDEVNLLWLGYRLKGIHDPAEMARDSGRDVEEFYRAAPRRKRAVRKVLGVPEDDEETE